MLLQLQIWAFLLLQEGGAAVGFDLRSMWSQMGIPAKLVVVILFMVGFYHVAGLIAIIVMAMNILIVLWALCVFDATLTLPGIAGLALTIGMAVDANVLIYERLREKVFGTGRAYWGEVTAYFNTNGYEKIHFYSLDAISRRYGDEVIVRAACRPDDDD